MGVMYIIPQQLTFEEALDLANFLAARLDRIRQLELDHTQELPGKPGSCFIVSDTIQCSYRM